MMEFKAEIIAYHCQTLLSSEHCLKSGAVISVLNSARSARSAPFWLQSVLGKVLRNMVELAPILHESLPHVREKLLDFYDMFDDFS